MVGLTAVRARWSCWNGVMSNTEAAPAELAGRGGQPATRAVEVLTARDVPLGGPRAMRVRRTLPQRQRSLIEIGRAHV